MVLMVMSMMIIIILVLILFIYLFYYLFSRVTPSSVGSPKENSGICIGFFTVLDAHSVAKPMM